MCHINGEGVEGYTSSEIKNVFYHLSVGVLIDGLCAFRVVYRTRLIEKIIKERGQELKAGCCVLEISEKAQIMLQRLTIGWYGA